MEHAPRDGYREVMTKPLIISSIIVALGTVSHAQESPATSAPQPRANRATVEWNASMLPFGGVGGSLGFEPAAVPHLRFAVGALAITLPEFGLGENKDMGWSVNDKAVMLEARYYLREQPGGFYAAFMPLYQRRTFSRSDTTSEASVGQYIVATQVGYEWKPFARLGAYITPNFTFAVRVGESGSPVLNGMKFAESRILPLPGVSLGWRF